jgi:uncharacterized protein (TIGR01777 family)
MRVLVSGSSGFIGSALVDALERRGHEPIRLVRRSDHGPNAVSWDPHAGTIDTAALPEVEAVVHLAGAGIGDHRWTDSYKAEILDSRVRGTSLLSETMAGLSRRPRVMVSGSAVGFYGDRGDEVLDETSASGRGFLPSVCRAWEAAAAPATEAGIRVVHIRTGIVLDAHGGALAKQLPLFKIGLGGRFGSGRQWQSWITLDDEVSAILHLLDADVAGPVNLTAPNPVTNAQFTHTLGAALHRPTLVPVPRFGPTLLLGGEAADALLYESQRVLPRVLQASGFAFAQPSLDGALATVLRR